MRVDVSRRKPVSLGNNQEKDIAGTVRYGLWRHRYVKPGHRLRLEAMAGIVSHCIMHGRFRFLYRYLFFRASATCFTAAKARSTVLSLSGLTRQHVAGGKHPACNESLSVNSLVPQGVPNTFKTLDQRCNSFAAEGIEACGHDAPDNDASPV
jgi:hypothetical protein